MSRYELIGIGEPGDIIVNSLDGIRTVLEELERLGQVKREYLRLTDRDDKGRFVKNED